MTAEQATPVKRTPAVLSLLEPWLLRRASHILEPRFGRARARTLVDEALRRHQAAPPTLGAERSVGGRMMVECAAITIALYRVLLDEDLSPVDARAETARVTAAIYAVMARVPWFLARLSARQPHARLKRATDSFRRFPFGPPAYVMNDVEADDQTVAFDVVRCPVAEHFRAQGLPQLCVDSWCNLDYALAQKWGARLERTTTLAAGDTCCDFRWHLEQDGESCT